jgi:hypothetical protein
LSYETNGHRNLVGIDIAKRLFSSFFEILPLHEVPSIAGIFAAFSVSVIKPVKAFTLSPWHCSLPHQPKLRGCILAATAGIDSDIESRDLL